MNGLVNVVNVIDKITEQLGRFVAWLTLLIVLLSFSIVLLRYGFNLGWVALQESVLFFHGVIFMLGAGYTLKTDGHVRVDIFYQRFSIKQKALVNLCGTLFLLMPVCLFIFFISFDYVATAWRIMEKSPEAGGLPFVYISKSLILAFSISLILQGLAEIARNVLLLKQNTHLEPEGGC